VQKKYWLTFLDVGDSFKKFPGIVDEQFSLSNYDHVGSSKFLPNKLCNASVCKSG